MALLQTVRPLAGACWRAWSRGVAWDHDCASSHFSQALSIARNARIKDKCNARVGAVIRAYASFQISTTV